MANRLSDDVLLVVRDTTGRGAKVSEDVLLVVAGSHQVAIESADFLLVVAQTYFPLLQLRTAAVTAWRKKLKLKKHWGGFQNAALLAAAPVYSALSVPHMLTAYRAQTLGRNNRGKFGNLPSLRRRGPLGWVVS